MKYFLVIVFIGLLAFEISAFLMRKHSDESSERHDSRNSSHEKKSSRKRFSSDRSGENSDSDERETKSENSLVIGLNPGGRGKKSEGVDKLIRVVKDLVARVKAEPLFRTKQFDFDESAGTDNKKRTKSSVGIELDTPTLLNFVKKVISSRKFKKATDEVARKAAVIFRALKESN